MTRERSTISLVATLLFGITAMLCYLVALYIGVMEGDYAQAAFFMGVAIYLRVCAGDN